VFRAVSLLFGLSAVLIGLVAGNLSGGLGVIVTVLGILAIIGFAILATRWTEDHDVSD